jgi:hypothetical protein
MAALTCRRNILNHAFSKPKALDFHIQHDVINLQLSCRSEFRVPQSSCFWFSLNAHDENAAEAKSYLSPSQIHEVEQLLKEWKEQHRLKPEVAAALHIDN